MLDPAKDSELELEGVYVLQPGESMKAAVARFAPDFICDEKHDRILLYRLREKVTMTKQEGAK